jgi:hypothetical protein
LDRGPPIFKPPITSGMTGHYAQLFSDEIRSHELYAWAVWICDPPDISFWRARMTGVSHLALSSVYLMRVISNSCAVTLPSVKS